jgi:hypothetical protein
VESLKMIFGDLGLPEAVYRLGAQKCNLNIEEAALIFTDEA